jgi:putative transposase
MGCPHCGSSATTERPERTELGYRRFRCRTCHQEFNERSGTRFNRLQYPTDIVCLVVLWRVRYKLSLRDLAEMFLERGFVFTHETVREWEAQLAPLLTETLRKHRRGKIGRSWYVDETYIKVKGRWTYLYRAIDRDGNLVDVRLSETRDRAAAEAFFRTARTVTDSVPERVTSDGHDAYPGAIKAELGEAILHRTSHYLNNHLEQDHRGIKHRTRPMCGFKSFVSAARFCRVHDEVRNFLRPRARRSAAVSLAQRWQLSVCRMRALLTSLAAA